MRTAQRDRSQRQRSPRIVVPLSRTKAADDRSGRADAGRLGRRGRPALVEPNPSRIESLVEEIALKKLLDGQFDECHLTLEQLGTIEDSLIKSLTGVYHGRIKYPGQQRTA